jgi:hypothetical protein
MTIHILSFLIGVIGGLPREAVAALPARGELGLDTTLAIMKVVDLHLPPEHPMLKC